MKRTLTILLVCFFHQTASLHAENSSELSFHQLENRFSQSIQKHTLSNGIRVILMKNGITPTLACYLKIGVGSSDEPFDQAGVAHFLEHLLFKGTRELGTNNFDKEEPYLEQISRVGERIDRMKTKLLDPLLTDERKKNLRSKLRKNQRLLKSLQRLVRKFVISEEDSQAYSLAGQVGYNAYTSTDVTNYQILLPKNRLKLWAWLESSRLLQPVFREFYIERKIIQEERKMRYDSKPSSLLYELFVKTAFGMSPYGKPVIGFASNIPNLRLKDTENFFKDRYVTSKMVIALVGDLDFEPTLKIVKRYFERIPRKEPGEFPAIQYEIPKGRKTAKLVAEHTPYLITGWYKPALFHKDHIVFEIINKLLTGGINSRLVKRLVIKDKLVQAVRSYTGIPGEKLRNSYAIFATPYSHAKYTDTLGAINEEIETLKREGPEKKELERVKIGYYSGLVSSLESNAGLANSLSYYELMLNDYAHFFRSIQRINNVSSTDIQRVLKKYFKEEENVTVSIQKPGASEPITQTKQAK